MYDPLYDAVPEFEASTGIPVDIVAKLPHPELNAYVRRAFESGTPGIDLLSTHTKYAPSQVQWLSPLDGEFDGLDDLLHRPLELSRIGGRLVQVPRNLDVRLLHYRRDLFEEPAARRAFEKRFGRPLEVPHSWTGVADVAEFFASDGFYGFLFPGRDSGLFGTFYELLISAGGDLFDAALRPAFDSREGEWAAMMLADLHHVRKVTPRNLPQWHYDEISAAFRAGQAAMVCDWPGSYHLYQDRSTCRVARAVALAPLPVGPAGISAAYAGCHSFAIAADARNREGALALLKHFTSFDAQLAEARRGAIPCRASALAQVRQESSADTDEGRRWGLLADAERTMIIPPRFPSYPLCEDAIWQSIQHAMTGSWTPRDAVRRAAEAVDDIVASTDARATVES
jgi:multiple sugar transport system substrate-binding protein